ncbi:MAG: hypothetical protein O2971_10215 [Proteobacteria bacterium]|nr:hypothetical protein [Pseudomonadota bacterium]
MNRREFLLFRTEGSQRVAELSCEKLFMHFQDLNSSVQQGREEQGTLADADWWAGEPALLINTIDHEEFFRAVLSDLQNVDQLSVKDVEWLVQGDFRIRVDTLLAAFQAGGGQVSYQQPSSAALQEEVSVQL